MCVNHRMFLRNHLLKLELNSFMNSAVILCYWVLKIKQYLGKVSVFMCLGWAEEGVLGEQVYNCVVFLGARPGKYSKYYPEEIFFNI